MPYQGSFGSANNGEYCIFRPNSLRIPYAPTDLRENNGLWREFRQNALPN